MKSVSTIVLASMFFISGCATDNKNTMIGAGLGTAVGAGVGALMGKEKGALIGAAVGGGLGAYAGNRMDKQAAELKKIAETKRTEQGLVTKLKSDILFDVGKSELKPSARTNLSEMASIMKKYPENVLTVKGYTDNTGSSVINERLSTERAQSVKNALVAAGMPSNVITIQGMGPANPIGDNSTAEGRGQNRRVEIEITVDESKIPKEKKK
jgi:outer membrane protein OmpA-like peptidoglycan-associated protein